MSLNYKTAVDTSFVTGDSPVVIDLLANLGSLAQHVVIFNDGPGDLDVEMSLDGTAYGAVHTVKASEAFGPEGASISSIRITWVSDSAYRVVYSDKALTISGGGEGQQLEIAGEDPNEVSLAEKVPGVDNGNSSVTNLTAGTSLIFTGTWIDVSGWHGISVLVDGTSSGMVGGTLEMQLSHDGVTVHRNISIDNIDITNVPPHALGIVAQYFRVKYTADSDLLSFDIQTMLHTEQVQLVSRMNQVFQGTEDVATVRALTVPHLDIARKHITSQETDLLFGFNDVVGTTRVDATPKSGDINWPTSAAVVGISSSDAADASAGDGVRQVEIHGLSATGADQDEIVTMNGVTEVDTALSYIRITKLHSENVGTYGGSHQGDITARVGSSGAKSGDILAVMTGQEGAVDTSVQYGSGEMDSGQWSVPLGKVAYLIGGEVYINTTGTKTADIILYEREGILNTSAPHDPRRLLWSAAEVQGVIPIDLLHFQKIKQLTDIWFRAKASNANTKIEVTLYFYVLDENAEGA